MKIDIETRIPLETGKMYYTCEAEDEYIYSPCSICEGTGKVVIKGNSFTCPECMGNNSDTYEMTGVKKTKWRIAKHYLSGLTFDRSGNVTNAYLKGINTDNIYIGPESLIRMEIYNGKIYDDYGEVLREVKKRNKEENEKKV